MFVHVEKRLQCLVNSFLSIFVVVVEASYFTNWLKSHHPFTGALGCAVSSTEPTYTSASAAGDALGSSERQECGDADGARQPLLPLPHKCPLWILTTIWTPKSMDGLEER